MGDPEGEAPRGQLIGPRSTKAGGASLTLLRTLTLGREPEGDRPRRADLLAQPDKPVGQYAESARSHHEHGRTDAAAQDWLAVFCLDPSKLPAPVIPWVALNRIRALDSSDLAIRFYTAQVGEIDRVIKERPPLDREALLRSLVTICAQDWDAPDEAVVDLVLRLQKLNRRHPGFPLVLGIRLLHAGRINDAGSALSRAETAAQSAGFGDRRESLRLLHLYRGAVQFGQRDAPSARRSFRRAMALEPRRLEAPLMYAELEASLGRSEDRLNQRRALRLVGKVEAALGGEGGELRPWLKAVVGERCAALRKQLGRTP